MTTTTPVSSLRDRLVAADLSDRRAHAVVAHAERILGNEPVDESLLHAGDLVRRGVPPDDLDLARAVGDPGRFDRTDVTRLVGREDALEVGVGGEDVRGHGQRGVVVVLAVLGADQLSFG